MRLNVFAMTMTTVLVSGCSWVKLAPGAEAVTVRQANQVGHCERLGNASAKSLHKVGFINRNSEKLQSELQTMARNEASAMGGNTVVAESEINAGQQKFGIYRCP